MTHRGPFRPGPFCDSVIYRRQVLSDYLLLPNIKHGPSQQFQDYFAVYNCRICKLQSLKRFAGCTHCLWIGEKSTVTFP